MVFEMFRSRGDDQVQTIEVQIADMLATTRKTYRWALDAVLGRTSAEAVDRDLHSADRVVNQIERDILRGSVVHAGVRGARAEIPVLLVYARLAKNIERIGDLAKDIWDLADSGLNLGGTEHAEQIARDVEIVSGLFEETSRIFADRDEPAAERFLAEVDGLRQSFERRTLDQLTSDGPTSEAVGLALLYRHKMRIVANLMNVMTSVVVPIDRLDHWDEEPSDRVDLGESGHPV